MEQVTRIELALSRWQREVITIILHLQLVIVYQIYVFLTRKKCNSHIYMIQLLLEKRDYNEEENKQSET